LGHERIFSNHGLFYDPFFDPAADVLIGSYSVRLFLAGRTNRFEEMLG